MKTIQVNIPIGRTARRMEPTTPTHKQNLELQALCEDQLRLIQNQRELLEFYEAELDRQASRLTKCLWAIVLLILTIIVDWIMR